jgi:hypothetical protein
VTDEGLPAVAVDAALRSARHRLLSDRGPVPVGFTDDVLSSLECRWRCVRGEWTPPESASDWIKEQHRERHPERYDSGQETLASFTGSADE